MNLKGKTVSVRDGNVDDALRKLKKRVLEDGLLQELQERQSYVKPTVKKKVRREQAKKRWRKYLRAQELPKKLY